VTTRPGEQSGGDWAVVEWRVRAGDEPPIHTHTREDEALYVLDGAITAYVGDGHPSRTRPAGFEPATSRSGGERSIH
jgi:quercetin dioxygenase-like cupin family protein